MFNDIFPMMAMHQMELDEIAEEIIERIRMNGTENQDFSIIIPCGLSAEDIKYIEQRVESEI